MTNKYYLICDQNDCFLFDENLDDLLQQFANFCLYPFHKEGKAFKITFLDFMKSKLIQKHESDNGKKGYFIAELDRDKIPKNYALMEKDDWCEFYRQNKELAQGYSAGV